MLDTAAEKNACSATEVSFDCRHLGNICQLHLIGQSSSNGRAVIGQPGRASVQQLVWTVSDSGRADSVPLSLVLNASTPIDDSKSNTLELIVARRLPSGGSLWSLTRLRFTDMPGSSAGECCQILLEQLRLYRRLSAVLLFINPASGVGDSVALSDRLVLPWLAACGVRAVVVRTERRYHARDYLLRESLSPFDGVLCIGGDGILSELVHGLLLRRRLDLGIDGHGKFDVEHPTDKPVGVIPCGSTDAIVHSVNGNSDATTALVHILLGNRVAMDVTSVYDMHTGEFLAYNLGLLSYGYFGDVLKGSESLRWLGPARYDLMGAITLMRLPRHLLELTLIETEPVRPPLACHRQCPVCSALPNSDVAREAVRDLGPPAAACLAPVRRQPAPSLPSNGNASAWRQSRSRLASVSSFTMPCRSAKSPYGAVPFAHLADGRADLVTVPGLSRLQFVNFLLRLTCRPAWVRKLSPDGVSADSWESLESQFQLEDISVRRVSAFAVRVLSHGSANGSSAWNSDGELLRATDIVCRVNPRLLTVFGSHIDPGETVLAPTCLSRRCGDPVLCCSAI